MKPGPKKKPKKERIVPRSIAASPDDWKWCIAEATRQKVTVSGLIRILIDAAREGDL